MRQNCRVLDSYVIAYMLLLISSAAKNMQTFRRRRGCDGHFRYLILWLMSPWNAEEPIRLDRRGSRIPGREC